MAWLASSCRTCKMSQNSQYFSELKKSLLSELVNRYKDVLEAKKNHYRTIKVKNDTSETVAENFNSQSGVTRRDSKQLEKCRKNMDIRAKIQIAKGKRDAK